MPTAQRIDDDDYNDDEHDGDDDIDGDGYDNSNSDYTDDR